MTLQAVIDKEEGPTDGVSNLITVYDDAGALIDAADAVSKAQLVAPTAFFGINQDVVPDIRRIAPHAFEVRINYRYRQQTSLRRPLPQATNTVVDRGGPFQVKRKFVKSFLLPIGVYDSSGDVTANHDNDKWLVNQLGPGFDFREPGAWIEPLPQTRTKQYTAPAGTIDDAYVDAVEAMIAEGAFNNATYFGRAAGTLQLVYFDFSDRTPDDSIVTYGFGYKAAQTSVQVTGNILIPTLYATDYYYFGANQDGFDPATGVFGRIPRLVYHGQVWPTADYDAILQIPGAVP